MGAATLNQPASLRASDAWSSERATRIGATRARLAAVGGVGGGAGGKRPCTRQRWLGRSSERAAGEGRGSTYPSMAHRGDPRGTERRRRNSKNRPNGSEL